MSLRILIADDEESARFGMAKALSRGGYEIIEAADGREALEAMRSLEPRLVFLDLDMPLLDGRAILREISGSGFQGEVIVVTANDTVAAAVECMRLGASDYLTKPFEVERLRAAARRCAEHAELERRVKRLQSELDDRRAFGALVGSSQPMRQLYSQIERAAQAPLDILIRGETGTGKELIAREIHRLSPRSSGPFVPVNTAAIAESLAESELFGHVRGAFTGAEVDRAGVFEQASGGTIFLDEIGDMPVASQAKILRTLQERVVQRVGSTKPIPIDVRVISATHQDLAQAMQEGHFRQDLYYRVRGVEIAIPPLRARMEDIAPLADHFLLAFAASSRRPLQRLSRGAIERLLHHSWPGNVRELEQAMRAAAAMTEGEELEAQAFDLSGARNAAEEPQFAAFIDLPLTEGKARLVEAFERRAIQLALERSGGNVSGAARQLGIHRQSLQQRMAQLGIARRP